MNELPSITEIGHANEVILGITAVGTDLDGSWVFPGFEFREDSGPFEGTASGK